MISYIGGKSRISSFIKSYIPKDIETYVEPFGGAFWVFFKLDIPSYKNLNKVVYNDINPLNVNLFLVLKENPERLYNITKGTPIENPKLFKDFQREIFSDDILLDKNIPNYDIAFKYAYVLSQVWSGTDPKKGNLIKKGGYVSKKDGIYKSKFEIFRSKLVNPKWLKYFSLIDVVEGLDYKEVIKKYDSNKTFFYCDPPYFNTEDYYSNHNFKSDSHKELSKVLKNIEGKFGLSYYFFDELKEWFPKSNYKWRSKDFVKNGGAVAGKKQSKGTELLILN